MVCMLALFRIEKTEGPENVKWTTGLVTCVTFGLEIGRLTRICQASTPVPVSVRPERRRDGFSKAGVVDLCQQG